MTEMNKKIKIALASMLCVTVGVLGYGIYTIVVALGEDPWNDHRHSKLAISEEAPESEAAAQASSTFFSAWSNGDLETAALETDDPDSTFRAMIRYRDQLAISKIDVTMTPEVTVTPHGKSPIASLPFGYHATVHLRGHGTWSYAGLVRAIKATNGSTVVHWDSSVLHPRLTEQTELDLGELPPAPAVITDSAGTRVTQYASIKPLVGAIANPEDPRFLGKPGTGVMIKEIASGKVLDIVHTSTPSKPAAPLKLTIDGPYQKAAEKAIAKQGRGGKRIASLVAIQPSTGHILAIANTKQFNAAFSGLTAPGSTMKIITAAALMEHGATPDTAAPCPARLYVDGKEFHNVENSSNLAATLRDDFSASCNTGFIGLRASLDKNDLTDEARDVFGIGLEWHTGLANADGKVPVPSSEIEKAASMIGQGSIQMNPLAMASVAATVSSGEFRQPVIRTDIPQQKAARSLSPAVVAQLRDLMRTTAVRGTAAGVMAGLSGGAKTGTAEVGSANDSWFVGYHGDVAVAAMVEGGGHGSDAAGPAVRAVLTAGS
ncbi:penicillin-binding transpeptidase domain-containing protein [Streptomyces sp. NPDC088354]|uniref:penicillin-binding transpeptidase domain-containing protein n=1 Tax=Streptomyces sp. NPDC088354 TaxID=3365856 RepID=UPI0037FD0138